MILNLWPKGKYSGGEFSVLMWLLCVCTMQNLLSLDHCIGIIGGKPKHSVYFVGFQGEITTVLIYI